MEFGVQNGANLSSMERFFHALITDVFFLYVFFSIFLHQFWYFGPHCSTAGRSLWSFETPT